MIEEIFYSTQKQTNMNHISIYTIHKLLVPKSE